MQSTAESAELPKKPDLNQAETCFLIFRGGLCAPAKAYFPLTRDSPLRDIRLQHFLKNRTDKIATKIPISYIPQKHLLIRTSQDGEKVTNCHGNTERKKRDSKTGRQPAFPESSLFPPAGLENRRHIDYRIICFRSGFCPRSRKAPDNYGTSHGNRDSRPAQMRRMRPLRTRLH